MFGYVLVNYMVHLIIGQLFIIYYLFVSNYCLIILIGFINLLVQQDDLRYLPASSVSGAISTNPSHSSGGWYRLALPRWDSLLQVVLRKLGVFLVQSKHNHKNMLI